ncbi:MAG: HD-GYP domain-containing protein [Gammaproteobacteria bacterium]|nr:HD-GYP domain-containing protein [Gammaproteobacteria bacterium]MDH3560926.1 HD-GYP domain-containing protein [Gammaproteobacteria bacterium]
MSNLHAVSDATDSDNRPAFTRRISTVNLMEGMYVQELDRPWVETPFLFQGFKLEKQREIEILQELCEFVYINIERGIDAPDVYLQHDPSRKVTMRELVQVSKLQHRKNEYKDTTHVEDELGPAKESHRKSQRLVDDLFDDIRNKGKLNVPAVREAVDEITDSVLRNPDAFMLLRQLKSKDTYSYSHAIDSCALAASFCRHLGFPKDELKDMAMGTLLLDIGKLKVPKEILDKQDRLTEEEFRTMQRHVTYGVEMLIAAGSISKTTIEMVATHHERLNGKGYPQKLKGETIPVSGRIAAIVDCYDAMTSERPYKKPVSAHDAIRELYKWRGTDFQEELVEQFIQCLGIYPTGTLVELNSGQVAIVLSQNRVRRLSPKLLLILNADKVPYEKPHIIDLMKYEEETLAERLTISHALDPEDFDFDPSDYYL